MPLHPPGDRASTTQPRHDTHAGPQPPDVPGIEPGAWIGNFRLGRRLGQGGMGEVFLARDAVLGRDVALKFIRGGQATADSIRRFFVEGRATAALNHPNVVVVYDLQQHDDQPYLVLELVRGRTLAELLEEGPLPAREAARVILGCASALAAAHEGGLLHRDFKPANVVVGDDRRPRVLDFGLAYHLAAGEQVQAFEGTPAYMAPEQMLGRALTPAADVWALGLVFFECLTGNRIGARTISAEINEGAVRREIDARLAKDPQFGAVIAATLQNDPAARPTARDVIARLEQALGVREGGRAPSERCPFPGLDAYDEGEAEAFGGRDAESASVAEHVRRAPFTTLVGPSGVGKTSLVLAGVIPRLRELGVWHVIRVRPGLAPLRALADAVAEGDLAAELATHPERLGLGLFRRARASGERVLLLVDQLEELYTHPHEVTERRAFEEAVARATSEADDAVRVVLVLREDFIGRAAESGTLRPALEGLVALGFPSRAALTEAIRASLAATGFRFEDPQLLDEMMVEAALAQSALPLVSFACRALWEKRDVGRRWLLRDVYRSMGGVVGALAAEADRLLRRANVDEQRAMRTLFLRLVGPGGTRRVVARAEVARDGATANVLTTLAEARLVHVTAAPGKADATVEIVHEALIRSWATLASWVDESREERALAADLSSAVALWSARGARPDDTWSYDSVLECRARIRRLGVETPPEAERFLAVAEARELRRRRWRRAGAAIAVAIGVSGAGAAAVFAAQAERLRLAHEDRGHFAIALEAFDVTATGTIAAPVSGVVGAPVSGMVSAPVGEAAALQLFAPSLDDPTRPGPALGLEQARIERAANGAYAVEARGGAAFLRVGRRACGPVWIPLRKMPGYADRDREQTYRLAIPTCAASVADMIEIAEGPFFHGGAGEPPVPYPNALPLSEVTLPRYAIDRTEVTNRAYRVFARMGRWTGHPMPEYPDIDPVRAAGRPERPVTKTAFRDAEAYCRYLGKRLPTPLEWEKAARGGRTLDRAGTVTNPEPQRNVPWGGGEFGALDKANLRSTEDGFDGPAPVGSYPAGASPYGVLDLVGNVREWLDERAGIMRPTAGGEWDSSPDGYEHVIAYRGERDMASADFGQGFRCARDLP